ncbi:MAG: polysaccharide deacetylase [Sphingomonadales bacterium]|nr:polysaccharide deacetylase [Sphingomonadales bacterium]
MGSNHIIIGLVTALLLSGCGTGGGAGAGASPQAAEIVADPGCTGPLTGRRLGVDAGSLGFGTMVKPSGLTLKPNEFVLTIDDGPTPETLPELLQILRSNCVRATFFMVGKRAAAHPELVDQILRAGHTIGSHSWDHAKFGGPNESEIEDNMRRGAEAVEDSAWNRPSLPGIRRLIRLPDNGGLNWKMTPAFAAFLKTNDFALAGIDASPEDWRNDPATVSYRRLFSRMPDRGVILLHDWPRNTPSMLRLILSRLQQQGASIVAIDLPGEQASVDAGTPK